MRDYIKLLHLLNIDYTYLEEERCCGAPFVMQDMGGQGGNADELCRELNTYNIDHAAEKGAGRLFYCCAGCVYTARDAFSSGQDSHAYILDLVFEKLEKQELSVPQTRMAYFEGCHTYYSKASPKARFDWARYRKGLDRVDGLELADLKGLCCKTSAEKIIERVQEQGLKELLCPCNFCYASLKQAAGDRIKVLSVAEFILRALEHTAV